MNISYPLIRKPTCAYQGVRNFHSQIYPQASSGIHQPNSLSEHLVVFMSECLVSICCKYLVGSYWNSLGIFSDEQWNLCATAFLVPAMNLFHTTNVFLCPLKTSENYWFCDVFRGCRNRSVAWNGSIAVLRPFIENMFYVRISLEMWNYSLMLTLSWWRSLSYRFALQINELFSTWKGPPSWKS